MSELMTLNLGFLFAMAISGLMILWIKFILSMNLTATVTGVLCVGVPILAFLGALNLHVIFTR